MNSMHGGFGPGSQHPFKARNRFVAVLDVLGMKSWVEATPSESIAEKLHAILVQTSSMSSGQTSIHGEYGPLVGSFQFSDTILLWTLDDSWASFALILQATKSLTGFALAKFGVPLRGAISIGEAVCEPSQQIFVGKPIAEAFLWAEKERKIYTSVGVDITPVTLKILTSRKQDIPIEECWACIGFDGSIIDRESDASDLLIWYKDCLFLNHWQHGMFVNSNIREMFSSRKLPTEDANVAQKLSDAIDFYEFNRSLPYRIPDHEFSQYAEQQEHYQRLELLRRQAAA